MMFSFYRLATGAFTGRRFDGPIYEVGINTPVGCAAITGAFDRLSQRVDVAAVAAAGEGARADDFVIAYRRPQAQIDAEQIAMRDATARLAIVAIERNAQPRAVREALLSLLADGPAKSRLQTIDDEIAAKREGLKP